MPFKIFFAIILISNFLISQGNNLKVWGWGWGGFGNLGNGKYLDFNYPVQALDIEDVEEISAHDYSLALKKDGTVWAWGPNGDGQLGIGEKGGSYNCPVKVLYLEDIISIDAGGRALALKRDGTVWEWPRYGTGFYYPVKRDDLEDVIAISAGGSFNLVLKRDGTVWAWGSNYYGQLGNGEVNYDIWNYQDTPSKVLNLENIVAISAGYHHSLALKADGTVWAWGYNVYHQCGTLYNPEFYDRVPVPVQVQNLNQVKKISAGNSHSLALKEDGTVWIWGDVGDYNTSIPEIIENLISIKEISAGGSHSLALEENGTIWSWGYGWNGTIANGRPEWEKFFSPVKLLYLKNAKIISSSLELWSSLAIAEGLNYLADIFIPAVAKAKGAEGTNWKTDLEIYNPEEGENCFKVYYVERGKDGTNLDACKEICLDGRKAVTIEDAIYNLCGKENTAGNIRIERDKRLFVTSRVYNQKEEGTYGQFIKGVTENEAILKDEEGFILGIKQNSNYRTNIGFTEVKGLSTKIKITFCSSEGEEVSSKEIDIKPFSCEQWNLKEFGFPDTDNGYIKVRVEEGGGVIAYGSVVDNKTGDAVFIRAEETIPTAIDGYLLVPVIAKKGGGYGTNWQTDLWILNNSGEEREVKFTYFVGHNYYKNSIIIKPCEQVQIEDIVGQLFPEAGASFGSLFIINTADLISFSRTYNKTEEGTYGQFIPALKEMELISLQEEGIIYPVKCNQDFRTNIGFTEYKGYYLYLDVELTDGEGRLLGNKRYNVDWYGNLQVDLFKDMGIECKYDKAYAKIKILDGWMGFVYASIIDNRTGDAIFVPANSLVNFY